MKPSLNKRYFYPGSIFLTTVICLFAGFSLLSAAQSLITVNAQVDKSQITIGDRITYSLTIQHDKNLHIQQPGPGANLGQFEIKDYVIHDPVEENNLITQKFDYSISVFDTGKFVIPPFPVAFAASDTSSKYQIIQSEPIEIYVKSVLTSDDAEIHDIKAPQAIPFNYRRWILNGLAALLILGIGAAAIYVIRRRKKGVPLIRREVIRPAHEIALEALAALQPRWREMLENGEQKLLFTEISDILRRYLENRYFVKALEETTIEIGESLEEAAIGPEYRNSALEVLEFADMVKFAKYLPRPEEVENNLNLLETFIDQTKLVFEAVENEVSVKDAEDTETAAAIRAGDGSGL
ncbi:MAG: BatD family protein [Calditrichia bacterium]